MTLHAQKDFDRISCFSLLLQADLGKLGYKFQFVTLAGFHALNHSMFQLAKGYGENGMTAYSKLQQEEFAAEKDGYTATKHQREVLSKPSRLQSSWKLCYTCIFP